MSLSKLLVSSKYDQFSAEFIVNEQGKISHYFRCASEMNKPHGNYLAFLLQLPSDRKKCTVTINLEPYKYDAKNPNGLHSNLLFLNKLKVKPRKPLVSDHTLTLHRDRDKLYAEGWGDVSEPLKDDVIYFGINADGEDEDVETNNRRHITNGLCLTIVKPSQRKSGVTLEAVLKDQLKRYPAAEENECQEIWNLFHYTNTNSVMMHAARLRIRVDEDELISPLVYDSAHLSLDIDRVFNQCICERGHSTISILMKKPLRDPLTYVIIEKDGKEILKFETKEEKSNPPIDLGYNVVKSYNSIFVELGDLRVVPGCYDLFMVDTELGMKSGKQMIQFKTHSQSGSCLCTAGVELITEGEKDDKLNQTWSTTSTSSPSLVDSGDTTASSMSQSLTFDDIMGENHAENLEGEDLVANLETVAKVESQENVVEGYSLETATSAQSRDEPLVQPQNDDVLNTPRHEFPDLLDLNESESEHIYNRSHYDPQPPGLSTLLLGASEFPPSQATDVLGVEMSMSAISSATYDNSESGTRGKMKFGSRDPVLTGDIKRPRVVLESLNPQTVNDWELPDYLLPEMEFHPDPRREDIRPQSYEIVRDGAKKRSMGKKKPTNGITNRSYDPYAKSGISESGRNNNGFHFSSLGNASVVVGGLAAVFGYVCIKVNNYFNFIS